jgi:uncharacterized protein YjdB
LQLTATVTPADYDTEYYSVVFTSGTTNKATVNSATGLVTGVAEVAEVVITAEFKYLDGETWTSFDTPITDTIALEVTAE